MGQRNKVAREHAVKYNSPPLLSHLRHLSSPVLNSRLLVLGACTFLHLELNKERVPSWEFVTTYQNTPAVPWWLMCWSMHHVLTQCCYSLQFLQTHVSVAITAKNARGWRRAPFLFRRKKGNIQILSAFKQTPEKNEKLWTSLTRERRLKDIKMLECIIS